MPPRRRQPAAPARAGARRAGYQPGRQLSPELEAAIDDEAARISAITDHAAAVREVTEFFNALEDSLEAISEPRLRAIAALHRQTNSYEAVAQLTGLSKSRVGQLAREARGRGY